MIIKPNYEEPRHTLKQVLEETPDQPGELAYAVVVGPVYSHTTDERLLWKPYQDSFSYAFEMQVGDEIVAATGPVDTGYTELLVRDGRAALYADKAADIYTQDGLGRTLLFASAFYNTANTAAAIAFDAGRPPQPGDVLKIVKGGDHVYRTVAEILGADVAASTETETVIGGAALADIDVELVSSSVADITNNELSIEAASTDPDTELGLWFRQNGHIGSGWSGLRATLRLTCTTGGAPNVAAFSALWNDAPAVVSGVVAAANKLTLTVETTAGNESVDIVWEDAANHNRTWTAGENIVLHVFFPISAVATGEFVSAVDLSDYTQAKAVKAAPAQLSIEVTNVATNGNVTLRVTSSPELSAPVLATLESDAGTTVNVDYDGATLELTIDGDLFELGYRGLLHTFEILPPRRSTSVFDKIRLNGPTSFSGAVTIDGFAPVNGVIPAENLDSYNYVAGENIQTEDIQVLVPGYPAQVWKDLASGEVAVKWRQAQLPAAGEALLTISNRDDIIRLLGSDHPDSEGGYGALVTLLGGQGRELKVLRTAGSSANDFRDALARIESVRSAYALAVVTTDENAMREAVGHAFRMSDEFNKKPRRVYVGTDTPGEYVSVELDSTGAPHTAAFSLSGTTFVAIPAAEDFPYNEVSVGDKVLVVATDQAYEITAIGDGTLTLKTGPAAPIASTAIRILAADTPENVVRYLAQRTDRLGSFNEEDRRVVNVWADKGEITTATGFRLQPMRFVACEIAGARAAMPPHQGLSRHRVRSISRAPGMYARFRREHLNELGASGVWIVTQDAPGGPVYVRHQVTAAREGGVLFYEDSAGANLDLICFEIDDLIDPKIGKTNANRRTLVNLKAEMIDLLKSKTEEADTPEGQRLGPRVERFFDLEGNEETVSLTMNPNFKDQFDHGVILELPVPLNRVRTVVIGRTISTEGTVVTGITSQILQ